MIKVFLLVLCFVAVPNGYCLYNSGNFSSPDLHNFILNIKHNERIKDAGFSTACFNQFLLYAENLLTFSDGLWGLKMIDASGKIPAGLISTNLALMGNFDECIEIEAAQNDVKGKYCVASIGPSDLLNLFKMDDYKKFRTLYTQYDKTPAISTHNGAGEKIEYQIALAPSWGLCIPHKCSKNDLKLILDFFFIPTYVINCQTKEDLSPPLDTGAIATISFFAFFALLMTLGTIYDISRNKKSPPNRFLLGFSVYTNGKKLFHTTNSSEELTCLNGLRCLSMLWVVLCHNMYRISFGPLANFYAAFKYLSSTKGLFFINGVNAVDTFFVVTGFLVVYTFMKSQYQGKKFNIVSFYLHRYIRLATAILPALLFSIFLLKYFGSGPLHTQTILFSDPCKDHWYSTIFLFQNYKNAIEMCLGQTWYLNVDMQLYLLSPIVLLLLPKYPMIGISILLFGIMGVTVGAFMTIWNNKLVANMFFSNFGLFDYLDKFYSKTHTRASPWLVGAVLGYIMGRMKFQLGIKTINMPKWIVCCLWSIVFSVLPICVFGSKDAFFSDEYDGLKMATYGSFSKLAWAICISLIIFACSTGNGGIVNKFLSLPVFQILNRFAYSIYLIHLTILYLVAVSLKQPEYFTIFNIAYSFGSIFVISSLLSIFWVLAFESPVPTIEYYILRLLCIRPSNKLSVNRNATKMNSADNPKSTNQQFE